MKLAPDSPAGLGAAMAGGRSTASKSERHDWDYYPTPLECTQALLRAEIHHMRMHSSALWEPCAHGGQIVAPARAAGFDVLATDIRADPAHGVARLDLLATRRLLAPVVLTNFPWSHGAAMIDHLLGRLRAPYLCALFKTQYWQTSTVEGRGRLALFRRHPPVMRWDCIWRVQFKPGERDARGRLKHSTMNVSWFVWDTNRTDQMQWGLLGRDGPVEVEG
ncbi:hypothetical protein VH570_14525 [Sphingobium sp. HT1-2]|uniref:hypothetical protein n=1 Tax=Sphingobium sp. HT1-2 TaxID=3111640 RepID=UPI003BFE8005